MTFRPLPGRVLIKPAEPVTETESGLTLVQDWTKDTSGTVLSVGPLKHAPCVKAGDTVVFSWMDGQEIEIGHERYLLLREDQLLGVLED